MFETRLTGANMPFFELPLLFPRIVKIYLSSCRHKYPVTKYFYTVDILLLLSYHLCFRYTLDYISDCVYLMDMLVQSRTGYLEDGLLVEDKMKLLKYYTKTKKTTFILDCLAVAPTDVLYIGEKWSIFGWLCHRHAKHGRMHS